MPPTNTASILHFITHLQLLTHLPPEIVLDILSRLPIRTISICKCVCRSLRDLFRTPQFVDFYLSQSVPGLIIGDGPSQLSSKGFQIFEFDDEITLEDDCDLQYKPLTKMDHMEFITNSVLQGSVNGLLLLLRGLSEKSHILYVCNPMTCEYIELQYDKLVYSSSSVFAYGFGVSRISGQYKVVRTFYQLGLGGERTMATCLVYTLGTGTWRSIFPLGGSFPLLYRSISVYLNGNVHWLVKIYNGADFISCFDLETETFVMFSLPSSVTSMQFVGLVVLGDCLCVSDTTPEGGIDIWLMKKYGDDKSWAKEFVIVKKPDFGFHGNLEYANVAHPIKVFENGDILMLWQKMYLVYYSNKTGTIKQAEMYNEDPLVPGTMEAMPHAELDDEDPLFLGTLEAMPHTSSLLRLGSFLNERVRCF